MGGLRWDRSISSAPVVDYSTLLRKRSTHLPRKFLEFELGKLVVLSGFMFAHVYQINACGLHI